MNADEARQIMDYMTSASMRYTPQPFEPANMAVWYDHLRDINADVGAESARRLVEWDTDFPSFARFRQVATAVARERTYPALPAPGTERALYKCSCQDTGLVCVDPGTDSYRPCDRCNPDGYERWAKGGFLPKFGSVPSPETAALGAEQTANLREALDRIGRLT